MAKPIMKVALGNRLHGYIFVTPDNALTLQNITDIEGVSEIIHSPFNPTVLVGINPRYNEDEVIKEIEALNNVTPIPPEFSDAFQE